MYKLHHDVNKGQRPEDSINLVLTKHKGVQQTCIRTPSYRKRIKLIFDWTIHLFSSCIHHELSNLIGWFERIMVQDLL